jgi:hypothetical protein
MPRTKLLLSSVGREPLFSQDLSLEAAILRNCYQATTSEDIAGWKKTYKVWELEMVV